MLGTITKSGRVLDLFTPRRPEWGVSEVARELEMPKSGAHSLLSALVGIEVLRRTARNRYRLGWRLLCLTQTLVETSGFLTSVRPELELLVRRQTSCSAQLAVLAGARAVVVNKAVGSDAVPLRATGAGRCLPAHSTAVGKVLLAHCSADGVLRQLCDDALTPVTQNTITSIAKLDSELDLVRDSGFATDHEETFQGISCVAAPLRDISGTVVAAISITGPSLALRRECEVHSRTLLAASRRISAELAAVTEQHSAERRQASTTFAMR